MTLDEKIQQYAKELPYSLQQELLDFVEYLAMKADQQEKQEWSSFSLSSAMHDMEEDQNVYSLDDLKVTFT